MQLIEVQRGDAQAVERAVQLLPRCLPAALGGLAGEEEVIAVASEPRPQPQFSLAIGGRYVNVIDAVPHGQLDGAVGLRLRHAPERDRAQDHDRAAMLRAPKTPLFHTALPFRR